MGPADFGDLDLRSPLPSNAFQNNGLLNEIFYDTQP
jgi:hypothetical protein